MRRRVHTHIVLFFGAVLLPSLVLTAVGIRLLSQEDELLTARLLERRRVAAQDLSLQLAERLDAPDPSVVVATLTWRRNRISLPWEVDLDHSRAELAAASSEFRQELRRGEALEFTESDYVAAAEAYGNALELAIRGAPQALARVNLARALISGGDLTSAASHITELWHIPFASTDEYGLPFALFAMVQAERLPDVLAADLAKDLDGRLTKNHWLAPASLSTLAARQADWPVVDTDDETQVDLVDVLLDRSRRLESLRDEFASLLAAEGLSRADGPGPQLWSAARGEPLWLVGFTPGGEQRPLTVVRADRLLADTSAAAQGLAMTTGGSAEVVSLGPRFPGTFIRFPESFGADVAAASRLRQLLYGGALFVVVSLTGFGAWFLSRDIRREAMLVDMRSRFVASVSHELKTPLTAVRLFAEMLQRDRLPPEKRASYQKTILAESERLSRLLDNVLDFSKIERGEKHYVFETVRLQEPLRRASSSLEHQLARDGYSLELAIDDAVPAVVADADAIGQAVVNLISNAVKYSNNHQPIDLSLELQGADAVISVRDRGIGIDEADRHRIFNEFFRASAVERSHVPGTGLGLTIVAHIAEAHGARVEVDSEPGRGSTFSLRLPIASPDAQTGASVS